MSMPGTLPFSGKSHHSIPSEAGGDQSPTSGAHSSSSSAHEFSVFANVNIQGSSTSLFKQSQANLSTISTSVTDFSDTISLSSVMMAPELPKRSNSIISLANSAADAKPILSPRALDNSVMTTSTRHPPVVSPKCLESLREERSGGSTAGGPSDNGFGVPPTISPRTDKLVSYHQTTTDSSAYPAISTTTTGSASTDRSSFQNASHQQQQHRHNTANVRNSSYSLR